MKNEENLELRLPKFNLILICAGLAIIIIGFILMFIGPNAEIKFEPDIFSFRRIVLAPTICFIGFISIIFAILYKPSNKNKNLKQL